MRVTVLALVLLLAAPGGSALGWPLDAIFPPEPEPQDDCGRGGDAGPDEATALALQPPESCSGTFPRGDAEDAYRFEADAGQWVEFVIDDDPDDYGLGACPFGPGRGERGCYHVDYQNIQDTFVASASAVYGYRLDVDSTARSDPYEYNVSVRVVGETDEDPQDDCGTGAGAANDYPVATPLPASVDCVGALRGPDSWDIYAFHARVGQEIDASLDVADGIDHELCFWPPWGGWQCSTLPAGQDEELHVVDVASTGSWYLVVYRYEGDGTYGLRLDVHGEPGNEPPRMRQQICPLSVEVNTTFECSFRADDDSEGVSYEVFWGDGTRTVEPPEGYAPPGVLRSASHAFHELGSQHVYVRVTDSDGARAWGWGSYVRVRGPEQPQDDCATGADAGEERSTAARLAAPLLRCEGILVADDLSDFEDWYEVDVPENGTLRAHLDASSATTVCLIAPDGTEAACGEWEVAVAVPQAGTWALRVSTRQWENQSYQLSVAVREHRSTPAVALGTPLAGDTDMPLPGMDGLDGAWVDLPARASGNEGFRVLADGNYFAAWFYDADGEPTGRVSEYSDYESESGQPWHAVPEGSTRAYVQVRSYVVDRLGTPFELHVYH